VHDATNTAARFGDRADTGLVRRPSLLHAYFVLKTCSSGTIESTGAMLIPRSPPPPRQAPANCQKREDGKEILNVGGLLSVKKAAPQAAAYAQASSKKFNRP